MEEGWIVVDTGSGAGLDTLIAGVKVGAAGHVIGVDMTVETLEKALASANRLGYDYVEFREALVRYQVNHAIAYYQINRVVIHQQARRGTLTRRWKAF